MIKTRKADSHDLIRVQGARVNNLKDVARSTVGTATDANAMLRILFSRLGKPHVIVIEHHQAVMAHADWIIDLGPGAGHDGGRIVFQGTTAALVAARSTLTGEHLAAYVRS